MLLYTILSFRFFKRIAALLLLFKFSVVGINVLFIDVHLKSGGPFFVVLFLLTFVSQLLNWCWTAASVRLVYIFWFRLDRLYYTRRRRRIVLQLDVYIYNLKVCNLFVLWGGHDDDGSLFLASQNKKEIPLSSRSCAMDEYFCETVWLSSDGSKTTLASLLQFLKQGKTEKRNGKTTRKNEKFLFFWCCLNHVTYRTQNIETAKG